MILANLSATLLVLSLLTVKSVTGLWVVYLVAFIESSIMQFFGPAEKALLPCLLTERNLATANSLNAMNPSLGMFIGSAIGGMLMGLSDLTSVILFDCASYLIAAGMIFLISWSPEPISKQAEAAGLFKTWAGLWWEWLDGLKVVRQSRSITAIFLAAGIAMLGEGIIQALLVFFIDLIKGGVIEFGWLLTLRGLGGLLGGLIFGQIGGRLQPQRIIPWMRSGIGGGRRPRRRRLPRPAVVEAIFLAGAEVVAA